MSGRGRGPDAVAAATAIQRAAADPAWSGAVRAAAGSGKTHVLVERLARLLLAGAAPHTVVAVTFTRKAAVEIKSRLLRTLRELAAGDAGARRARLNALLDRTPTPAEMERAARLYDSVLEDLPGLPIGTIHSFCQRLLGGFAGELGLDPQFTIEERPEELWEEALAALERETAAEPAAREALVGLADTPDGARARLTQVWHDRGSLERWLARVAAAAGRSVHPREELLPALAAELAGALFAGTPLEDDPDPRSERLLPALPSATARFLRELQEGLASRGDVITSGLSKMLDGFATLPDLAAQAACADPGAGEAALERMRTILLTGKPGGERGLRVLRGQEATKAERQQLFGAIARPLLELLALTELVDAYRRSLTLLGFALRALDLYDEAKRRARRLDFPDLERLARRLMVEEEQAPYIHYRLAARLDHLLIDEFQDTNFDQWEILEPLAKEFLSDAGPDGQARTLFVVGDVKQSIYRFRGAEPRLFAEVESYLRAREFDDEGQRRALLCALPTNFRSLPAVVESVGALFAAPPLAELLPSGEARLVAQLAARAGEGEVFVAPPPAANESTRGEAARAAAAAAARAVAHLRRHALISPRDEPAPRAPRYGELLLLCRNRTHAAAYEQALREAGVPFVPAGRGALARSREAQDILLLLRWLVFPDDDAALASVLRSPLFRVGEDRLQAALAARREGARIAPLWRAVRRRRRELGLGAEVEVLEGWRRRADLESCHDLLRRIYRDSHAPQRYAASVLGEQARYNLLRLHDLALAVDLGPAPSLRRLIGVIERAARTGGEEEASLPAEGEGRVQLLTVHGAKGLERPIVLLVEAAAPLRLDAPRLALPPRAGDRAAARSPALLYGIARALQRGYGMPPGIPPVRPGPLARAADEALAAAQAEEADLLYVAMTRARDALYVLSAAPTRNSERPSYLSWLRAARDSLDEEARASLPARFEAPPWLRSEAPAAGAEAPQPPRAAEKIIAWDPPPLRPRAELVTPSNLAADARETGPDEGERERADTWADAELEATPGAVAAAAARGEAVHLWLRLAAEPGGIPPAPPAGACQAAAAAWAEARAVAANPALAWIFHPEREGGRGWSEAPIIHHLAPAVPGGVARRVLGVIDRLVQRDDRVDIIDHKSNRFASEAALRRLVEHYRPQLEAYRAAVAALFGPRAARVEAHLLFTNQRDAAGGQGRLVTL